MMICFIVISSLEAQKKTKNPLTKSTYEFYKNQPDNNQIDSVLLLYDKSPYYDSLVHFFTYRIVSGIKAHQMNVYDAKYYMDRVPVLRISENLQNCFAQYLMNNEDLMIGMYYLTYFKSQKNYNDILLKTFQQYTSDGDESTFFQFLKYYPEIKQYPEYKQKQTALKSIANLDFTISYSPTMFFNYDAFIRDAAPHHIAFVAMQRMLAQYIDQKNILYANYLMDIYQPYFETSLEFKQLKALLNKPFPAEMSEKPIFLDLVNTVGEEFCPVISVDEKKLYFCGSERNDNMGNEDIYFSEYKHNQWQAPQLIKSISTRSGNESPKTVNGSDTELMFYQDNSIITSSKIDGLWGNPKPLPYPINTEDAWESDACLSYDGNVLFFVSTRKDGYNVHQMYPGYMGSVNHQSDIYVCIKKDGKWSTPQNVGKNINTMYCERTPFLHSDMKTLYFSSNGHSGFGELDVFMVQRLNDSSWTEWSEPVNLGLLINTSGDDWGYKISTEGSRAYFSVYRSETKNDLCYRTLPEEYRPTPLAIFEGTSVKKLLNKALDVDINVESMETKEIVKTYDNLIKFNENNGEKSEFYVILNLGEHYFSAVEHYEHYPNFYNLDYRNTYTTKIIYEDVEFYTLKDLEEKDMYRKRVTIQFSDTTNLVTDYSPLEIDAIIRAFKDTPYKLQIVSLEKGIYRDNNKIFYPNLKAEALKKLFEQRGMNPADIEVKSYFELPHSNSEIDQLVADKSETVVFKVVKK